MWSLLRLAGEEFDVAPAGLVAAGVGDQRRHYIGVGRSGGRQWGGRFDDSRKMGVGR